MAATVALEVAKYAFRQRDQFFRRCRQLIWLLALGLAARMPSSCLSGVVTKASRCFATSSDERTVD